MENTISEKIINELSLFDGAFKCVNQKEKLEYLKEYLERFDPHTFFEGNAGYVPEFHRELLLNLYFDDREMITREEVLQLFLSRLNLTPTKIDQNAYERSLIYRMDNLMKEDNNSSNKVSWNRICCTASEFHCQKFKPFNEISIIIHLTPNPGVQRYPSSGKEDFLMKKQIYVEIDYLESEIPRDEMIERLEKLARKYDTQIEKKKIQRFGFNNLSLRFDSDGGYLTMSAKNNSMYNNDILQWRLNIVIDKLTNKVWVEFKNILGECISILD